MVTLKEQEAVDYLNRAKKCVQTEKYQPPNQITLANMLDIEAAYIQRLMVNGPVAAALIEVDVTGFPYLPSWLSDIKRAFKDYDEMRIGRQLALRPLLDKFAIGSVEGIITEGKKFSGAVEMDQLLARAVQSCKGENIKLLKNRTGFPFFIDHSLPGLLCSRSKTDRWDDDKMKMVPALQITGLKYIDSESLDLSPLIVYYKIIENPRILEGYGSINYISFKISEMNRTLFEAFLSLETAALKQDEKESLFSSLEAFNDFLARSVNFFSVSAMDLSLNPQELENQSQSLAEELKQIMQSLKNGEIEAKFRLALVGEIEGFNKPQESVALAKTERPQHNWLQRKLSRVFSTSN